jgi:hypothetical protein
MTMTDAAERARPPAVPLKVKHDSGRWRGRLWVATASISVIRASGARVVLRTPRRSTHPDVGRRYDWLVSRQS